VQNFPVETILPNLCEYVFNDNCGTHITGLKKMTLDGDVDNDEASSSRNKDEIFIVDTYEVMINKD